MCPILETEELVEYRRLEAIKNRIQLINMPQALKKLLSLI